MFGTLGDGEAEALVAKTNGWLRVPDDQRREAGAVIWPMFVKAYATIGLVHASAAEFREYDGEWLLHLGSNGVDAFQLTKKTSYGRKMGLGGSNGSLAGKRALKEFFVLFCNTEGCYGEVSHVVEIVVTKGNVPAVCAAAAQKVLAKDVRIEEDGLHYSRTLTIDGKATKVTKVMVGRPRGVATTPIQTPNCRPSQGMSGLTGREGRPDRETAAVASHLMMQVV